MISAIQTKYDGILFRSRLEARWAVFYRSLAIPYEYEKEGYKLSSGLYLPDFWLPEQQCWVEIKGTKPPDNESSLYRDLSQESDFPLYLFVGQISPDIRADAYGGYGWWDCDYQWCECPTCGCLGIRFDGRSDRLPCKEPWAQWEKRYSGETIPIELEIGCPRSGGNGDKGYNPDSERLMLAYDAARSARFERWET